MILEATDCSPLEVEPGSDDARWLAALAVNVQTNDHVLMLGGKRDEDEPIVYCEWNGQWRTGRYIGSIRFQGRTLLIRPRLGLDSLRRWLSRVNNLLFVESAGVLRADSSFIAELVAWVWALGLAESARHGLPTLRAEQVHIGRMVRGRLDLAATVATRAFASGRLISTRRDRTLDNPISRTVACAYKVLRRWVGPGQESRWLPLRCQTLLPQLLAAVGSSPELPTEADLGRVRYTPITERYRSFVRLSWQVAQQRGVFADVEQEGTASGVLLDVAELWELYVLSVLREAAQPLVVAHGTLDQHGLEYLLSSGQDRLAALRPDALVLDGKKVRGIVDAKYKFLHYKADREDLYQMVAYITRFGAAGSVFSALVYPQVPDSHVLPTLEQKNPWQLDPTRKILLLSLPHNPVEAVAKLHACFMRP